MTDVATNYQNIMERVQHAARRSNRSADSVQLIAVTKTVAPDRIREAVSCGVRHIGENRLQEALAKREPLASLPLTWHFIGHLQTNKAKKITEAFSCVHSIDRIEAAEALERHVDKSPLPVLIEVKLADEAGKAGAAEGELPGLIDAMRNLQRLELRGLMAVPPPVDDPEEARPYFRRLKRLAEEFGLRELSMGMTHDFEIAIEEGATMVRIGTGLFGSRQ
jgi:pyridoxal phosphate enzyme (YggS family)